MSSDIYILPGTQTFSVLDPTDRQHISTVVATTVTSTATSTSTTTVSSESNEFNVSNTSGICNLESTVGRNDLVGGIPIHWFNPQTISRINNGQHSTQNPFDLPTIPAVQLSSWFRSSSPVNRAYTNEVAKLGSFPIGIPTENCSKLTGTNVNNGEYQLFGSTNWQLVYPSYGSTVDGTDVLRAQPRNSVIDTYTRFQNDKVNPPSDTNLFSTIQRTKTEPDLTSEQVDSVAISGKGEPPQTRTVDVKVPVSSRDLITTTSSTHSEALIDSTQNQENLRKTQPFPQHSSTTIGRNEAYERTCRHLDTGNERIQNCTAPTDVVTSSTLTAAADQPRSQRVVNPSHRGVSSKINSNSTRPAKPSHYKRSEARGGLQLQSADSTGEVVQEFTEQRSEKRERSSSKTIGSEDPLFKGLSHQKENTTARSLGFGSNPYLPKFNASVSFPAMGLKQPQSLFPYPYLTKLTEAYTNNKIPLALGLNAMTTQPESADSMFLQPLLSHPLQTRTPTFTNVYAHHNSFDSAMALNMVGTTPAMYTASTEPSCYLDHLNTRNPMHTDESTTGVRTLEKQLSPSSPLHKKSAFNLAKGVAGALGFQYILTMVTESVCRKTLIIRVVTNCPGLCVAESRLTTRVGITVTL
ncbi:hypothetical protein AHF37_07951 [Paragonimus kellicotti]|nr:hypothetical protein AHF37_07951 [Paragonimus kellicotti]